MTPSKRIKVVIRESLELSTGKAVAQSVHAVLGLNDHSYNDYGLCDVGMSVVVLQVSDDKYRETKEMLAATKTPFYVAKDVGYTSMMPLETVLAFLEDNP